MMERAEIPKRVDSVLSTTYQDAERLRHMGTPTDPVSKVFDNDDLLIEIIVRLGFPTSLVRAALVCKRWFFHASHPAFLFRFRKLHPPRLLGFYASNVLDPKLQFVPMLPQPPELDIAVRANFSLDTYKSTGIYIAYCQNNNVFFRFYDNTRSAYVEAVHNPLCPDREMVAFPRLPTHQFQHHSLCTFNDLVFKEENDNLPYFYVWIESNREFTKSTVHVYMLQDGAWSMLTSITRTQLHFVPRVLRPLLVVDSKIYIASLNNILVLDLLASSFSIIQHPQGVEYHGIGHTMLSRSDDDSGVYLIHAKELQLEIWLHKRDTWSLVDTICLQDMLANLRMLDSTFEDGHSSVVFINQVGNNVEFAFLQMGRYVLYLDIKCRTIRKVYEAAIDGILHHIHPFFMIWPPTFPTLKDCK